MRFNQALVSIAASMGQGWYGARSLHSGGITIGMCDGSATFLADDVELVVWRAMSSRAGGETAAIK